jgi:hypothetical protein
MFSLTHKKNASTKPRARPGYVRYVNMIGNDPFVDWTLILLVCVLIAASLICVGVYTYFDTQSQLAGQGTVSPASMNGSHFDVKQLQHAISTFDARANERVSLGSGYAGPADPSLP